VSARRGRVGGFAFPLGLFMLVGLAGWGWSAWRLVRGRATPAVVVSSGVTESRGRGGASYRPAVTYRYVVADSERVGTTVLPGAGEGRSRVWAEAIAARFVAGDSTVAYVDPGDPGAAYLVRQPSAGALLALAAPLAVIGLLLVDGPAGADGDPVPAPDPAPAGPGSWALALRDDPAREANAVVRATGRWRPAVLAVLGAHLVLVAWCAAGAPGLGGALAALWRSTLGDGLFVFDAAALGGAWWYVRRQRRAAAATAARLRGARVVLDRPTVRIGAAVSAALQPMLAGPQAALRDATLRLERETRERPSGKVRHRDAHAPLDATGAAAETTEATSTATFVLPAHAVPSSARADEAPSTGWAFVARLRFVDGHEATLRFPVRVHAAAGA
jgi:hypothetical protein